jgi:type IV pilus assembly protein PilB
MLKRRTKKLEDLLLERNLITSDQLQQAVRESQTTGEDVGKILVRLGYISEEDLLQALADHLEIPFISLNDYEPDENVLKLLPSNIASQLLVLPLFEIHDVLTVAVKDPHDVEAIDTVRRLTGKQVEPVLATEKEIRQAIAQYYGMAVEVRESLDEVIQTIEAETVEEEDNLRPAEDLRQLAEDAPVVKLVNLILAQAIRDKASDIHIEPEEDFLRVRFRIDGILHEVFTPPKQLQSAIISRIKILSEMDIAETRVPQDGRFRIRLDNREVDLRVSTLPTAYGENIVIRVLDRSNVLLNIEDLGFTPDNRRLFEEMLGAAYGIILVTGPTGSGKTTTLYSALNYLNSIQKNIITIEDPIEYRLKMIRQSQVNPKAGMTFASGLRAILRQDPDIIMVGEIRDSETANIAVQAALTGHLVLSTLHTNDAVGALTRLEEMGIEPFLVGTAAVGVIAQRLVRKICDRCKEPYEPNPGLLRRLGLKPNKKLVFYRGRGCGACKGTGYRGRTGIYEILKVDDKIRELIIENASAEKLRAEALRSGMKPLKYDGILKAMQGVTTIEEVMRVTNID